MSDRPRTVLVDGVPVGRGSRVRLRPSRRADILDLALTGREAEVDAIEEDLEGQLHLAVLVRDDPGRDLGASGKIGHRFFFTPEEVEPLEPRGGGAPPRVLVAGIGNMFLADDGFGPEVVAALRERPTPPGVHLVDFGIRGMDLAYRLLDGYSAALLVDAAPRGEPPGTLSVIEPDLPPETAMPEAHAMDPVRVLALARRLGDGTLPRVLVLGCEPEVRMTGEEPDVVVGLSVPVKEAVSRAVPLVESLVAELLETSVPAAGKAAAP
ncbi:hydrogenase maturation protease [Streptomyces chengmaiensis]|uniref:hydrogenase maturation protease n=1 Tax=Streptomyces chengmaiensis TaxID=3040919 RepID=UPI00296237ED|nr:hydrogenase maturation protease [Streptomyces chengmaiensis]